MHTIKSAKAVEHSYHETHEELINNIEEKINELTFLKTKQINLNIFDYYVDCNFFDATPYQSKYKMIEGIDKNTILSSGYDLNNDQFLNAVKDVKLKNKKNKSINRINCDICLNLLSIGTSLGLYVLAYKNLKLDIKNKRLVPD